MGNPATLKPFKKGKDSRRNEKGRPRKYVSLLKDQGYKLSEINDAIQALMAMDEKELTEVDKNPKATVLERTVARAMLKSMNNSSLYSMETLLSRVHGTPKQMVEQTINGTVKLTAAFNDD